MRPGSVWKEVGGATSSVSPAFPKGLLLLLPSLVACQPGDGELVSDAIVEETATAALHQIFYGSGGLIIEAHVAVPLSDGPHPIVLFNHEGFRGVSDARRSDLMERAAQGQAVFASSYRGQDGSGGSIEYCYGEVDDVVNLMKVAESWPGTDGSRIVAGGWSHGACISLMLTAATDRLAGVAGIGTPSDVDALIAWHREQGNLEFAEEWESYVGDRGQEMSPRHEGIRPPALLLQGVVDDVVPLEQSCMMMDDYADAVAVGSYRFDGHGAPVAGALEDCQGQASPGDAWSDAALETGLVLVSYEGVGHTPSERVWADFWSQLERFLGPQR